MNRLPFHDVLKILKQKLRSNALSTEENGPGNRGILNSIILEAMNESEREKEQILNSLVEQVCYMDLNYNIKWINDAGLRELPADSSIDEFIGKPCYKVLHNLEEPCESCPVPTTLRTGWPWKEEVTHPDGSTKLVSSQPVINDNGNMTGIIEVQLDITMRKDIERVLEKSQRRAGALLDVIPDLLLIFNDSGNFIDYHPGADFDLLSKTENPEGKHITEILPATFAEEILKNFKSVKDIGVSRSFEYIGKENNSELFYDCRLIKTSDSENVVIIKDVSSQKIREKEILHKSFHDKLTGLYNRAYFEEELKRIEQSRQVLPTSILVIDVNSLKLTNDAFGHDFGDKLLTVVADIISINSRKSDVIARTGGDEFSIILPNSPLSKAEKLSQRIMNACRDRDFDDIFARPSVSIGSAERSDPSVSLQDTIKLADENMYKMKLENRMIHLNTLIADILESMKKHGSQSEQHTDNCIMLARTFAKYNGLSIETIESIEKLARLHDIGNIRVSNKILSKKDKLSADEYSEVRQHSIIGFRIAKAIPDYAMIADLILYHHERWDGSGYPSKLKGKDIPFLSRMFAIVDTYELLTGGTQYKTAVTKKEALKEIVHHSGKQFDPDLVDKFLHFIKDYNN